MIITIRSVSEPEQPEGKKYFSLEVDYKDESGRNATKKLMSFSNPQVFKDIQNFKRDDVVEVTVVKNSAGYLDWTAVKASNGAAPAAASAASGGGKPVPKSGGTYETAEERAARQVFIIRQSSLSTAANILTTGAKTAPAVADVIAVARQLEDYVFGRGDAKEETSADPIDFEDDIIL
jgi:hypothetical protein